jgi:hypothetical protein
MYFQAIDDKKECIGIYRAGVLEFDKDKMPEDFSGMRTWKYSGSIVSKDVEYGWLRAHGKNLEEMCPPELQSEWARMRKKMMAFKKSFEIAKIDFRQHCFFDLVPHDFLTAFLEVKNKITQHVFETVEEPAVYEHLCQIEKLLYKIRYQELNVSSADCRHLFVKTVHRSRANKITVGPKFIDYNIFGTKTGRLATYAGSFPLLTMHKELRALIKPHNDWFISLDYNAAEARTVIGLLGKSQPEGDVHQWHMDTIFENKGIIDREAAKTAFFSWLYNPMSVQFTNQPYDRDELLEKFYKNGCIETLFGRSIEVDEFKALNYIVQSTTADLVNERAVALDAFLEGTKSFVSHIVHDEVVLDMDDEDRQLLPEIKEIFAQNRLAKFEVNFKAGKDYYNLERLNV